MTSGTTSPPVRIVLADDHAVLRAALRALLDAEPDMTVVGEAATGGEAVETVQRLRPDVVVMDIEMPGMNGLEAIERVSVSGTATRMLVLTAHGADEYLLEVLQRGGSGYVLKQSGGTELLEAIRTVARGDVFLYPSARRLLLQAYRRGKDDPGALAGRRTRESLSKREEQVLVLTAEGYSNPEIARRLSLSTKTVDTYRQRIMEKLDLHHRSELVHYALDCGLLRVTSGLPGGQR